MAFVPESRRCEQATQLADILQNHFSDIQEYIVNAAGGIVPNRGYPLSSPANLLLHLVIVCCTLLFALSHDPFRRCTGT